jgi:hypothetical protein
MTRSRNPGDLTESERFAEIADLLARGVLRWRARRGNLAADPEKRLDAGGGSEALCGSHALNPRSKEPAA